MLISLLAECGYVRGDDGEFTYMTRGRRRYSLGPTKVRTEVHTNERTWVKECSVQPIRDVLNQLRRQLAAAEEAAERESMVTPHDVIISWIEGALGEVHNALFEARDRAKESARHEDGSTVEALEAAKRALEAARDSVRPSSDDETG